MIRTLTLAAALLVLPAAAAFASEGSLESLAPASPAIAQPGAVFAPYAFFVTPEPGMADVTLPAAPGRAAAAPVLVMEHNAGLHG